MKEILTRIYDRLFTESDVLSNLEDPDQYSFYAACYANRDVGYNFANWGTIYLADSKEKASEILKEISEEDKRGGDELYLIGPKYSLLTPYFRNLEDGKQVYHSENAVFFNPDVILKNNVFRGVGFYDTFSKMKRNALEDYTKLGKLLNPSKSNEVEECFGGGVGGVTTASFAPAALYTVYPRPSKKKPKKKK